MGGGAPSVDGSGHMYVITGNGGFDATSASAPNNDYGDSLLQLSVTPNSTTPSAAFNVVQYFTPEDQASDEANDHDFGAGGAAVLGNVTSGTGTVGVVVGGGKDGSLYILNQASLGGYSSTDATAWQKIVTGYLIFSTVAMWNDTIYLGPFNGPLTSYALKPRRLRPNSFSKRRRPIRRNSDFPDLRPRFRRPEPRTVSSGRSTTANTAPTNRRAADRRCCMPTMRRASSSCGTARWPRAVRTRRATPSSSRCPPSRTARSTSALAATIPAASSARRASAGELDVYGLQPN